MQKPHFSAIVVGGSGAVGSWLVRYLMRSERCDKVLSLVRKPYDFSDEIASRVAKLTQTEVGFDALASFAVPAGFTVAFCCLGHADPSGVSKEEFIKVDVEYVHAFAKLCKASGVRHFSFVSAVNASPKSLSRYGRTKFKAETAVQSVGFSKCSIFRPSILITHGHKNEKLRTKIGQDVAPKLTGLLSSKYKEVRVEDLARAMWINAEFNSGKAGEEVLEWDDFQRLWAIEKFEYDSKTDAVAGTVL